MNRWCVASAAVVMSLVAMVSVGRASVLLYDNLGQTSTGSDHVSASLGTVHGPLYNSFSTAVGSGSLVTDVRLLLKDSAGGTGSTTVGIYSDSGNTPGVLFATVGVVNDTSLTATAAIVDVLPGAPISLAANTRYWIGLSTSDNSTAQWVFTSSSAGLGVSGQFFSNSSGTHGVSDGPYQMAVVPEPSVGALAFAAVACAGVSAWWRRSR